MVTSEDFTSDPENVNYVIRWWVSESKYRYHCVRCRGTIKDFQQDVWVSILKTFISRSHIAASLSTVITNHCRWTLFRETGIKKYDTPKRKFLHSLRLARPVLPDDISGCENDAYETTLKRELTAATAKLMITLTFREAAILRARFGLFGDKDMTLEEVGQVLKLTRERIRHIESDSIKKLQHYKRARKLMEFVDYFCERKLDQREEARKARKKLTKDC